MTAAGTRGRPRDERRSDDLLRAGLDLLGEVGYDRLTMGAVAERAGVGKNTLYRRWPDKLALVTEACHAFRPEAAWPEPSQPDLRSELVAQADAWRLDELSGAIVAGLVSASAREVPIREPLGRLLTDRDTRIRLRIEASATPFGVDLGGRLSGTVATVLQAIELRHWSTTGVPMTHDQVAAAIDDVLLPLLGLEPGTGALPG